VNAWVKQGILLGFRFGDTIDVSADHGRWPFYDKDTLPLKKPGVAAGVRIVPGGSTIREGAFVDRTVVCMPPMYINIGAYVGEGSLVDSHALVGSCAQIGRRVHCRRPRRSAASSSPSARCRSSSRTTCWLAATRGCTKAWS
jgi:2,3,4,5-tetrahydropyridine-2,6-dicarboxylate N-succinyltransferase